MTPEPQNKPDDLLELATSALRACADGRPAAPEDLPARTLARLQAADAPAAIPIHNQRKRFPMKKLLSRFSAAAAMIVVAIGVAIWIFSPQGSNVAFAQVIEQIRQVRAARFKLLSTITLPRGDKTQAKPMTMISEVLIVEPAWMRLTMEGNGGIVEVTNMQENKMLTLVPAAKMATLIEMTNMPAEKKQELARQNLLEQMKNIDPNSPHDDLGEREIAGQPVHGFRVSQGPMETVFWVDGKTKLPVRFEITTTKSPLMPQSSAMGTDFEWNLQVDPSLVSFDVPKDYTLNSMKMDMSTPGEGDAIATLRELTKMGDGAFPPSFDMQGISQVIAQKMVQDMGHGKRTPGQKGMTPEDQAQINQLSQEMMKLTRGLMFAADPKQVEDWHYAGKGVKLGQGDTPIAWYRPKGSKTYRLIDANLEARDITSAEAAQLTAKATK